MREAARFSQARMVGEGSFLEAQGPEPRKKWENGGPAQRQAVMHQRFCAAEPLAVQDAA